MSDSIKDLAEKVCQKTTIYHDIKEEIDRVFLEMKHTSIKLTEILNKHWETEHCGTKTVIDFEGTGNYEFQLNFAEESLLFTLHNNVVSFPDEHIIHKNPMVKEDNYNAFFGLISVFNFLQNSLDQRRLRDSGFLVSRFFINKEKHFYTEGLKQMTFLYPDLSKNKLEDDVISLFLVKNIEAALNLNPILVPFEKQKTITVAQRIEQRVIDNVRKVGFQMSGTAGAIMPAAKKKEDEPEKKLDNTEQTST